ncbi:MAG: hypothetical protein LBB57_06375 [Clostridiales Family XIII bacterium]|nr:hypothetical protein [Clostridiales Family XIII bacterium]
MTEQRKMLRTVSLSEGENHFRIETLILGAGNDIQIYIGGGGTPHIGSVAICLPRESRDGSGRPSCTTSVYNVLGHKDDALSVLFAEAFCRKFACAVVASAGVHMDNARPEDLKEILAISGRLLKKAIEKWRE